ncbi:hypothetical protein [Streptomyces sp. b84]|uniref:hypothetical protein n=1 Tax=Streptomyces sp. b84 TaxID=1827631 RepID=UPI000BF0AC6A|nr:hypothetical protein [Streptomyces sp. b84]
MTTDNSEQNTGAHPHPPYDPDAYREELARIGHHQSQAIESRNLVYQALAAAGIGHEEADTIVSQVQAGAVAGAHTCISESTAPHGSDDRFEDGWHEGVRDVARQLLHIADTTATANRGIAASRTLRIPLVHPEPTPQEAPTLPALDPAEVLAAAESCLWALAPQGERHWPDGAFLATALSAVRPEEHAGYADRLQAFARKHRKRLEDLLHAYGPGSTPASHGRYALIGQPETLVILERMETAPFLLRGTWDDEEEDVFLDDLEFAWGPRIRLSRR